MQHDQTDLIYQKTLELLRTTHKDEAISSLVHSITQLFGFYSILFLPAALDNRQLNYVIKEGVIESQKLIAFDLEDLKHPFSHVFHEKKAREIEQASLNIWQNQSPIFRLLISNERLENGVLIMPICDDKNYIHGCLVMSLTDYRNNRVNIFVLNYFIDLAVLHLKSLDALRLKEDQGLYLSSSITRSEQTYLDYLKKVDLQKHIISHSPKMDLIIQKMAQIIDSQISVLLVGKRGTGKTYLANILRKCSNRKSAPLIKVDCSQNMESWDSLFFTKKGFLSRSKKGTLLLENVECLPQSIQKKLASVFLNKRYEVLETKRKERYEGRIVSTTVERYGDLLGQEWLRPDFFAQINQVHFVLPNLDERKSDLKFFVEAFITQFNRRTRAKKKVIGYNDYFLRKIINSKWEGNLHELRKYVESKARESRDGLLKTRQDIYGKSLDFRKQVFIKNFVQELFQMTEIELNEVLNDIEFYILEQELETSGGKRQLAADKLNLPLRTLAYKCLKHGL